MGGDQLSASAGGPFTVGLTGGLASGKSTVARRLAERGFLVVDADRLVAELYGPGQPGAGEVARLFGAGALAADGSVDKRALARTVFSDPEALRRLEHAIHPLVRARFAELAAASDRIAVHEATRLVEAGFAPDFDRVISVEAPVELRRARAIARGLAPADANARLAAQGDGAERRAAAQVVIENSGTAAELLARVDALASELERLAAARRSAESTTSTD